jgi:hypothetical protein
MNEMSQTILCKNSNLEDLKPEKLQLQLRSIFINPYFFLPLFILSHSICTLLLRCLFRYFVFVSTVLSVLHMLASDGRLFRCDVTSTLSNGAIAAADDAVSDEDWEEREASRTHSVKFSDPQDQDSKEVKTH